MAAPAAQAGSQDRTFFNVVPFPTTRRGEDRNAAVWERKNSPQAEWRGEVSAPGSYPISGRLLPTCPSLEQRMQPTNPPPPATEGRPAGGVCVRIEEGRDGWRAILRARYARRPLPLGLYRTRILFLSNQFNPFAGGSPESFNARTGNFLPSSFCFWDGLRR